MPTTGLPRFILELRFSSLAVKGIKALPAFGVHRAFLHLPFTQTAFGSGSHKKALQPRCKALIIKCPRLDSNQHTT